MSATDNYLRALALSTTGAALYGIRDSYRQDPQDQFINMPRSARSQRYLRRSARVTPNRKRGRSSSRSRSSSSRGRPRARTAAPSARRTLYNNGATFVPSLRSSFRRTRYYRTLGLKPGRYPSKKHLKTFNNTGLLDKTQYVERLITAPYSTDEKMNARQGRLVNVRGVKLRMWVGLKNQGEASNKFDVPIMVRWAILNPKENSGLVGDIDPTNFFISPDPGTEEAIDFAGTGTCFDYHNRQINRRKYGVMQQGKFVLHQDPSSSSSRLSMGCQKMVNVYLPIHRQMKWANNVDDTPNTNIYFVYWYTQMGDRNTDKAFSDGPIEMTAEAITYFRDSPGFN